MAKKNYRGALDGLLQSTQPTEGTEEVEAVEVATEAEPQATPEEEDELISQVKDEELKELLKAKRLEGSGRPKKGRPHKSKKEGYKTISIIVNENKYELLREMGLRETLTIKEVFEAAMDLAIQKYEEAKGQKLTIRNPEERRGDASTLFSKPK